MESSKMRWFIVMSLGAIFSSLFAKEITIANYNVENLFDLKKDGYEYKEYIPYTRANWNKKTYYTKLQNTARVIADINADIIALEEVESLQALKDLRATLKRKALYYRYYAIANKKNTTVKVAVLSKIPFVSKKEIVVGGYSFRYRNILQLKYHFKGEDVYLFINHWKSKSGPESQRIVSAKALRQAIKKLGKGKNVIVTGDFNSHYEEYLLFRRSRRHNDTHGITGINDILGSRYYTQEASRTNLHNTQLYNLWYDLPQNERYNYIYKRHKETLDSFLISASLLDKKGFEYIPKSFHVFKPNYLFYRNKIYNWKISHGRHKAKGYSDHLPIVAHFRY
jgi:endonuclease/exonuclease/phosphatase family metal-dependent hydrolase